jgi:uncharacterized protein (TIGR03083 family)
MQSVFDFDKDEVVRGIGGQRARSLALLGDVPEPQWETIVVPRWRLREVAAHLISTDEASLTGRLLALGLRQISIERLEAWNDDQVRRWADRPIPELLGGLERWGRRIATLAARVPGRLARRAIPTPFGKVSLLWLGMMRVYDEWVHLEDVRRAFGMPSDDAPESVRPVARQLYAGIPVQSFPRIPGGASGRVELSFDDVDLPALGIDLGTRAPSLGRGHSDAGVSGRAAAIVMVAARRTPWREAEERGSLKVEGDRPVAETFLDALLLV